MSAITSPSFQRLVQTLKKHKKTVSVVEQCCGGLIQTSIMAQPGASRVYIGGCIPYNTSKTKPLLLNSTTLHQSLLTTSSSISTTPEQTLYNDRSTSIGYINSKYDWTTNTAIAFCNELQTVDYVISEGGAAGPTFQPSDMTTGFTVISIAGRTSNNDDSNSTSDDGSEGNSNTDDNGGGSSKVLTQKLIQSTTNNRQDNMRLFADAAAELLLEILTTENEKHETENDANDNNKGSVVTTSTTTDNDTFKEKKEEQQFTLDRCTVLRSDDKALEELELVAKYIVVLKTDMLFKKPSDHELSNNVVPELALLSYEDVMNEYYNQEGISTTKTFLGRLSDEFNTPIFSIDILDNEENDNYDGSDQDKSSFYVETDGHYFSNVRTTAPLLNTLDNGMALHAMAYANWQRKNKYCTNCGGSLELIHGNTCQKCASCQTMSWPRQDPSMIVSIISRCGSKILLARSPRHPPKMHTVLAGFVEVGETFESAVARETFEEVGIRIDLDSIKYIGSQPWPFPQSCMIAFTATADETQLFTIDTKELIDAKWFSREDVVNAASKIQEDSSVGNVMSSEQAKIVLTNNPSLSLLIPPKRVIARTLIDEWLYNTPNKV